MTEIIQIIAAFCGSLGFGILFNARGVKLLLGSLGGMMAWSIFLLLGLFIDSEPVRFCIVSMCVAIYAEVLARIFKTPTTSFIIVPLVPLIPGGALYYTMSSIFIDDIHVFFSKAGYALSLAFAIAIGVVIAAAAVRLTFKYKMIRQQKSANKS